MEITYTLVWDYYLPNLAAPESPKEGRWGMRRFNYLRKHREALYTIMLMDLKTKTARLRQQLAEADSAEQDQQRFLRAVRKFLEMDTLTAPLLSELVEKIIIHETEGTGRNRTQRIEICYRFVGYLDIPEAPQSPIYQEHIRQGVEQAFYTA